MSKERKDLPALLPALLFPKSLQLLGRFEQHPDVRMEPAAHAPFCARPPKYQQPRWPPQLQSTAEHRWLSCQPHCSLWSWTSKSPPSSENQEASLLLLGRRWQQALQEQHRTVSQGRLYGTAGDMCHRCLVALPTLLSFRADGANAETIQGHRERKQGTLYGGPW